MRESQLRISAWSEKRRYRKNKPSVSVICQADCRGTGKGIDKFSEIKSTEDPEPNLSQSSQTIRAAGIGGNLSSGREFTVGILGMGKEAMAVGVMEVVYNEDSHKAYSYFNKINYEDQVQYILVQGQLGGACKELALKR